MTGLREALQPGIEGRAKGREAISGWDRDSVGPRKLELGDQLDEMLAM